MRSACLIACLLIATLFNIGRSDEPADEFLEQLRENGYYDIADQWLDHMQTSPLASEAFRKKIDLEKATNIIAQLDNLRSYDELEAKSAKAVELLDAYAKVATDPDAKTDASIQRVNLLLFRATAFSRQAKSDRINASERNDLNTKARAMLAEAKTVFEAAAEQVAERGKKIAVDPENPETLKERNRLGRKHLELKFKSPLVKELLAETYGPSAPEYKPLIEEAAKEFGTLYDQYKDFYGNPYCIDAARCYEKIGMYDDAIMYLADIFTLELNQQTISYKRDAALIAIKCWQHQDPYPFQQVIAFFEPLFDNTFIAQSRDEQWLQIKLELAKAFRARAIAFESNENKTNEMSKQANIANRRAMALAAEVSRTTGEPRQNALELMKEWGRNIKDVEAPVVEPPATFEEARQRGVDKLGQAKDYFATISEQLTEIDKQLAQPELSEQERADLMQQKQPLITELESLVNEALDFFALADDFATADTTTADRNLLRMRKCEAYYTMQYYYESAIIGRFMLDRYPTEDGSEVAAQILARSYWNLYRDAPANDNQWEKNQLADAAATILKLWPKSPQANEVSQFMMVISQQENDIEAVKQYLATIETDSPVRGQGEIWLGQQLRDQRLIQRQQMRAAEQPITDDQRAQWKQIDQQALNYLTDGLKRVTLDNATAADVRGAVTRIEILLELNQVDQAVEQLEKSRIAPLDLAKSKHPAVEQYPELQRSIFRAATRTYLAAMQTSDQPDQWTQKADGVINALRQSMISEPDGQKKLVGVYIQLANQLKEQLAEIEQPAQRKVFSNSLVMVLEKIEDDAKDANVLLWSATTVSETATLLSGDGQQSDAEKLFRKSDSILARAEQLASSDSTISDEIKTEIQRQKALAKRGLGSFQTAIEIFADILEKNQSNVRVQIDAATTYQMWGSQKQVADYYVRAMMGGEVRKDPKTNRNKNVIWGWRTLCQATNHNEALADIFYLSLAQMVECRLEYGKLKDSEKAIRNGLIEIQNQYRRDPEMGGPKWKPQFDDLARRIQKAVGESPTGLVSLKD
jgi:cellulose synthase operon protein C